MAQPYVGEIRMFASSFAPAGWEFCNGQILPISENETLFQLIGTMYGGDGQETFALPDMRGRVPIHRGTGSSGTPYQISERAGVEEVTLTVQQIPVHTHAMIGNNFTGSSGNPTNSFFAKATSNTPYSDDTSIGTVSLNPGTITPTGGSQPHTNLQPYACINFIISLYGLFPSQT
jgi:microcystin-dependent protein